MLLSGRIDVAGRIVKNLCGKLSSSLVRDRDKVLETWNGVG